MVFRHRLLFRWIVGFTGVFFLSVLLKNVYFYIKGANNATIPPDYFMFFPLFLATCFCGDYVAFKVIIKDGDLIEKSLLRYDKKYILSEVNKIDEIPGAIPYVKLFFRNKKKPGYYLVNDHKKFIEIIKSRCVL